MATSTTTSMMFFFILATFFFFTAKSDALDLCLPVCDSDPFPIGSSNDSTALVNVASHARGGSIGYARDNNKQKIDARILVFCHTNFETTSFIIDFDPLAPYTPINCSQGVGFGAVLQWTTEGVVHNQYFNGTQTTGTCWDGFCAKTHDDPIFETAVGSLDQQNPGSAMSLPILLNFNLSPVSISYFCLDLYVNMLVEKEFKLDGFNATSKTGAGSWSKLDSSCDSGANGYYPYWVATVDVI